jgi:hypothetical protein
MFYTQNAFWTFHVDPDLYTDHCYWLGMLFQTILKTWNIRLRVRSEPTVVTNITCFPF